MTSWCNKPVIARAGQFEGPTSTIRSCKDDTKPLDTNHACSRRHCAHINLYYIWPGSCAQHPIRRNFEARTGRGRETERKSITTQNTVLSSETSFSRDYGLNYSSQESRCSLKRKPSLAFQIT